MLRGLAASPRSSISVSTGGWTDMPPLAPRSPSTAAQVRLDPTVEGAERTDQSGVDVTGEAAHAQAIAEAAATGQWEHLAALIAPEGGNAGDPVPLPDFPRMFGFAEGVTGPQDPAGP